MHVSDILQTEEAFTVEQYTHTHTHTHTQPAFIWSTWETPKCIMYRVTMYQNLFKVNNKDTRTKATGTVGVQLRTLNNREGLTKLLGKVPQGSPFGKGVCYFLKKVSIMNFSRNFSNF